MRKQHKGLARTIAVVLAFFIFGEVNVPTSFATSSLTATISSAISLSLETTNVKLELVSTPNGTFGKVPSNIAIATNADGYKLYIADKDGETALVNENYPDNKIIALSTDVVIPERTNSENGNYDEGGLNGEDAGVFPRNQWGYSVDGITYRGISTSLSLVREVNSPLVSGQDIATVYFAAKVDSTMPAGTYEDTIYYSIIPTIVPPNAPELTRLSYNTFDYSSTVAENNPGNRIVGYYISTSPISPTPSSSGWNTDVENTTFTIDTATPQTYYVWAIDERGNISNARSISSYKVTRGEATNATLTTRYDATNDNDGVVFDGSVVVLEGTGVYAEAIGVNGYNRPVDISFNSKLVDNGSIEEITGDTVISTTANTIYDISTMQQMTTQLCNNTPTPTTSAIASTSFSANQTEVFASTNSSRMTDIVPEVKLTDTRDAKSYLVRKLADGSCWMAQNLELEILGAGQNYSTAETFVDTDGDGDKDTYTGTLVANDFLLTSENTDLNSKSCWSNNSSLCSTPDNNIFATQKYQGSNSIYSWGDYVNQARSLYNPDKLYFVKNDANEFVASDTGEPYEKVGIYYNWYAATAGSGEYTVENIVAPDSICPKGWHLPYGGMTSSYQGGATKGGYYYLFVIAYHLSDTDHIATFSSETLFEYPFNVVPAGYYHQYMLNRIGSWQRYWTGSKTDKIRYLDANSTNGIWLGTGKAPNGDFRGITVRCVAY